MSITREEFMKHKKKTVLDMTKDLLKFLEQNSDKAYTMKELMNEGVLNDKNWCYLIDLYINEHIDVKLINYTNYFAIKQKEEDNGNEY